MNKKEIYQIGKRGLLKLYSDIERLMIEISDLFKSKESVGIGHICLTGNIHIYKKEYEFDCGVQALRSVISCSRLPPTTTELIDELVFCGGLSYSQGLYYKNIEKAKCFVGFHIQYFQYLGESTLLSKLLYQKIPIIVSVNKNSGNHLILVCGGEFYKHKIVSLMCGDSDTGEYITYTRAEFLSIYNFRGIVIDNQEAHR